MTGRRLTLDQHFAEIEEAGRPLWEKLPDDLRDMHRIDRSRITQGAQCVCSCGAYCASWTGHLVDVREHRELWDKLEAEYPQRILLGAGEIPPDWTALLGRIQAIPDDTPDPDEIGACCGCKYRRHLVGLDACADCYPVRPQVTSHCAGWRRQLEGSG